MQALLAQSPAGAARAAGCGRAFICARVTLPTFTELGVPEPFSTPAAFCSSTEAGGVFRMNVKLRSCVYGTQRRQQRAAWEATFASTGGPHGAAQSRKEMGIWHRRATRPHCNSRWRDKERRAAGRHLVDGDFYGDDGAHFVLGGRVVLFAKGHDVHALPRAHARRSAWACGAAAGCLQRSTARSAPLRPERGRQAAQGWPCRPGAPALSTR